MQPIEAYFRTRRADWWDFCDALVSEKNKMHKCTVISPKPTSVSTWPLIILCTGKGVLRYVARYHVDY